MDWIKEAFIEGYKQRAEASDLIFDNASRMYAITLFDKWKSKQLSIHGVVKSFYCECDAPIIRTSVNMDEYCGYCGEDIKQ